ncbi:hypothetical protein CB1_000575006 [Camelus ferus]|nr:hypothetical protein CB1_000575006 [Camelus ferus]
MQEMIARMQAQMQLQMQGGDGDSGAPGHHEEGGKGQVKSRPEEEAATWARVEESLLHRGADWLGGEFELAQTGVGWDNTWVSQGAPEWWRRGPDPGEDERSSLVQGRLLTGAPRLQPRALL